MPSAPASPRRSARAARWGGPVSSASSSVRLLPETASRCVMSVARNASSRSGGTREVSPTTSPGSSARASGDSPSVAVRSPARNRPASRWTELGSPMTRGGPLPPRTTAASRSPSRSGGARRPCTRSRVDGSSRSQAARCRASGRTVTSTGARVFVDVPSGAVTLVASASTTTDTGASAAPRTRGRLSLGSLVTVTSAVVSANSPASAGTGPRRTSAACSAATAPAVAPHSRTAASAPAVRRWVRPMAARRRRVTYSRTAAARKAPAQTTATVRPGVPNATAAAAQAASAGGTRRRSAGPSCRGSDAPRGEAAAACTGARGRAVSTDVMAEPAGGDRRTGARRCR